MRTFSWWWEGQGEVTKRHIWLGKHYTLAKLHSVPADYYNRQGGGREREKEKCSFINISETLEHAKAEIRNSSQLVTYWLHELFTNETTRKLAPKSFYPQMCWHVWNGMCLQEHCVRLGIKHWNLWHIPWAHSHILFMLIINHKVYSHHKHRRGRVQKIDGSSLPQVSVFLEGEVR